MKLHCLSLFCLWMLKRRQILGGGSQINKLAPPDFNFYEGHVNGENQKYLS